MRNLLIALVSLLFVAGLSFPGVGARFQKRWLGFSGGTANSKSHFTRPSHQRIGGGFRQHRRHLHHHSFLHSKRHHLRHSRQLKRLPRFGNGIILGRSGSLQTRNIPGPGPIARAYARGIGVSPIMKSQEKKALQQVPRHSHSSLSYHHNNPEPWFLYGKGKEFRQMGLIPSFPQSSQGLK